MRNSSPFPMLPVEFDFRPRPNLLINGTASSQRIVQQFLVRVAPQGIIHPLPDERVAETRVFGLLKSDVESSVIEDTMADVFRKEHTFDHREERGKDSEGSLGAPFKFNVGQVLLPLNLSSCFSSGTTPAPAKPPGATRRPSQKSYRFLS